MSLSNSILLRQQALITCRAFFPDSENTSGGVICYKDGQPVVFVEITCAWGGHITYDVWVYQDHSKSVYSVPYDRMCTRLKELNRLL